MYRGQCTFSPPLSNVLIAIYAVIIARLSLTSQAINDEDLHSSRDGLLLRLDKRHGLEGIHLSRRHKVYVGFHEINYNCINKI